MASGTRTLGFAGIIGELAAVVVDGVGFLRGGLHGDLGAGTGLSCGHKGSFRELVVRPCCRSNVCMLNISNGLLLMEEL